MSSDEVKPSAPEVEAKAPTDETVQSQPTTCCGSCSFEALDKNPLFISLKEICMWRNLIKSAITFVVMNVVFLLILKGGYSFLTLICYGLLAVDAACFAYAYGTIAYGRFVAHKDLPNPLADKTFAIPKESFVSAAELIADLLNAMIAEMVKAFCFKDIGLSIGCAFTMLFTAMVGKKIRLLVLLYVISIISFIWPRLYHEQHEIIDKYAGIVYRNVIAQLQKLIALIKEKMPAKIGNIKLKDA